MLGGTSAPIATPSATGSLTRLEWEKVSPEPRPE